MATVIRPEISRNNKYWIDRDRYYELKHFCLQYPSWKKAYNAIDNLILSSISLNEIRNPSAHSDLTSKYAIAKTNYSIKMDMVERAAKDTDEFLGVYILKAVTEGLSYNYLSAKLNMPCSRDTYYDRYRKFFWLLNNARN